MYVGMCGLILDGSGWILMCVGVSSLLCVVSDFNLRESVVSDLNVCGCVVIDLNACGHVMSDF